SALAGVVQSDRYIDVSAVSSRLVGADEAAGERRQHRRRSRGQEPPQLVGRRAAALEQQPRIAVGRERELALVEQQVPIAELELLGRNLAFGPPGVHAESHPAPVALDTALMQRAADALLVPRLAEPAARLGRERRELADVLRLDVIAAHEPDLDGVAGPTVRRY